MNIELINKFVPPNLQVLIGPHLLSHVVTGHITKCCNMPQKFVTEGKTEQNVGDTIMLINTLQMSIFTLKAPYIAS